MDQADISIYAVGDLHPRRDNPESIMALAKPALDQADIRFGQLEVGFSSRGVIQVDRFPGLVTDPKNVNALTFAGFDVLSYASNHTLEWGETALFDTIDLLRQKGISVIGVGKNIEEARQPAILERKGTRIAFLSYCSVLPKGYEARANKSGAVPLRATTYYEQVDWQPGTPPRIVTMTNEEDLEAMKEDIKKVRPLADIVIVSMHWGVHLVPAVIAMYQKEAGHAAIEAGADLILGHHAHLLKGIEVYKGKAIFYSLGNFAFDMPITLSSGTSFIKHYGGEVDPEYPNYLFPPEARKSMIARCVISHKKIARVSFLPCLINKQSQPEVLPRSDQRSSEVAAYIDWCCKDQKLDTKFSWQGDEVVVGI